jgi:type II secretory pathway component PulK
MKKARQNGFVLILVIVAIAVIGVQMSALADIANTMQFQSQNAYLKACERNLLASGLAWAKENLRNKSGEIFDKTIQLDTGEMNIRGSALDVKINPMSDNQVEVQIDTSCSRGRQTLRETGKYRIDSNDQQATTIGTRESSAGD